MRELVYYVAVSIDGFIADADGDFEAFMAEGDHESVVLQEYADALPAQAHAALGTEPPGTRFDTVVMGWNTLVPALDAGIASPYPHLRQVVASRGGRTVDPTLSLVRDPLAAVRELKAGDGLDVWLCGGGRLAGALLPEVDRLVLKRHPVVLGAGVPLFGGIPAGAARFAPTRLRPFESGVVVEEYVRRRDP